MKRIALFVLTNLAVIVTLSIVAHLLGFDQIAGKQGLDFSALLGFAALFGFGGAFISLAISKWSAKMAVGARVIDQHLRESDLRLGVVEVRDMDQLRRLTLDRLHQIRMAMPQDVDRDASQTQQHQVHGRAGRVDLTKVAFA